MKNAKNPSSRLARAALLLACPLLLVGSLHAGQSGGDPPGKAKGKQTNKHATADPVEEPGCSEGVITLDGEQYCAEDIVEVTLYGDEALAFLGLTEPPQGWAWWSISVFYLIRPDGTLEEVLVTGLVVGSAS